MSDLKAKLDMIEDWPIGGPLAEFRAKASFDWKKMKLFLEDIDLIEFKNNVWKTLQKDPLFISITSMNYAIQAISSVLNHLSLFSAT